MQRPLTGLTRRNVGRELLAGVTLLAIAIPLTKRAANPAIDVLASTGEPTESLLEEAPAGSVTAPGVIVVRLAAPLFFANGSVFGDAVKRAVKAAPEASVRHVVIRHGGGHRRRRHWRGELRGPAGVADRAGHRPRVQPRSARRTRPMVDLGLIGDNAVYDTNRAAIAALAPGERI